MNIISEAEFQKNIIGVYQSVIMKEDPFDAPFQPAIDHRLLLYPYTYGLSDGEPWLHVLVKAIEGIGEQGFYLSLLERKGKEPWHWYVPLNEAHLYINTVFPLENAIYSVNGRWGLICSDENHALIGAPKIMIDIILNSMQDWDNRFILFLNMWKQYHKQDETINIDWLPKLVKYVYGDHIPNVVIQDTFFRSLLKID